MAQLENIEAIEKRLWKSADTLRANSELIGRILRSNYLKNKL
jgi:hypothetical protein